MKKKLFKSGNGWAVFLAKPILEILNINPEKDLIELQIEKEVLKIKKHNSDSDDQLL